MPGLGVRARCTGAQPSSLCEAKWARAMEDVGQLWSQLLEQVEHKASERPPGDLLGDFAVDRLRLVLSRLKPQASSARSGSEAGAVVLFRVCLEALQEQRRRVLEDMRIEAQEQAQALERSSEGHQAAPESAGEEIERLEAEVAALRAERQRVEQLVESRRLTKGAEESKSDVFDAIQERLALIREKCSEVDAKLRDDGPSETEFMLQRMEALRNGSKVAN